MDTGDRQSGRTAEQMRTAPTGAVFVWCNAHLYYPVALALHLGREDLEIVSPSWLDNRNIRGRIFSGVIADHECRYTLTLDQEGAFELALTRVREA